MLNQQVPMSPDETAQHLREKHIEMIRNEQRAGREVPAQPVSMALVGEETARKSVEASQRSMRASTRKVFTIPALPWHRQKES